MPRSRTSSDVELLVPLDRHAREPLHRQLEANLRSGIRDGRLAAGTVLPSTRALAGQLGVSRGIVVEAYEQLVAEGYLDARPGGTTQVARTAMAAPPLPVALQPRSWEYDFRPGRPDVTEFPRTAWLRSLRRVMAEAPADRLSYLGGRGIPELRIALASYLNRVRGTAIQPGAVVICSGFAQGVGLIAEALAARGARTMAVEDPSDPEYRASITAAGMEPVGVRVDEHGLVIEELERLDPDAVVVTAAHQYPTGGVLPADRRTALVEWAARRNAFIVEDDYDAEFRYDREPIGALQGLRPDHVIYTGSASKTLAPGLRLGWLAAPATLVGPITEAKQAADMGSAALDQLALADFIERGELDRFLRRMRPVYRARRDALLAALERHHPGLRPVGASAGLHVLAWLPEEIDESEVVARANDAGIAVPGLRQRWIGAPLPGLVFGYGAITEQRIQPGIAALAEIVRSAG
ncbi:MAG TPA: PLP-dependent aminotransferase family protein [Candidatus Limnocylindrales bacterium]